MKLARYVCSHCSRSFEAEEKDILECPGCFWSTSVKKAEEAESTAAKIFPSDPVSTPKSTLDLGAFFNSSRPAILPALTLTAVAALLIFNWSRIEQFLRQREAGIRAQNSEGRAVIKAGVLDESLISFDELSDDEKQILQNRLELNANRPAAAEEEKILRNVAAFQTGFVEKIPSQAWTYEKFKEVLAAEERRFKVPLPGSYKGKLEDLFKKHYLPGAEAFKAGDLVRARDLWVESLAFPVYSKSVAKHRGVALTLLRPFINDTLSKIGTINSTMSEQKTRERERELFEQYSELRSLIGKKSWPEAAAVFLKMEEKIGELENAAKTAAPPPPYPEAVNQVDEGIRATLFDILASPPAAISDIAPLKQDLLAKKKVIESFLPENLSVQQARYDEAMDLIQAQDWLQAEKKLREIELPPALYADAQEKVKILKKLQKPTLDSGPKSG